MLALPIERRIVGGTMIALAMLVLLLAGAAKLLDVPEFRASLSSWKLIPEALRPPLAVGVPLMEFLVAGLWIVGIRRRVMLQIALCLVAVFMAGTSMHLRLSTPPECRCFGLLERLFAEEQGRVANLWQGGIVLLFLVLGALLCGNARARRFSRTDGGRSAVSPVRDDASPSGISSRRAGRARGFTLTELLLSILIVALLIALLLPSLGGVRAAGLDTRTLANLRSSMAVLDMYANDWRDAYPCFADPYASVNILRLSDGRVFTFSSYFAQPMIWRAALADAYYDGDVFHRSTYPAEAFAGPHPRRGPFVLTCTLFTHPDFWREETRTGLDQFRGSRRSDVQFPSDKSVVLDVGFLLDTPPPPANARVRVAQADGSALGAPADTFPRGYHQGEAPYRGWLHTMDIPVARHTIGGMRGRDRP